MILTYCPPEPQEAPLAEESIPGVLDGANLLAYPVESSSGNGTYLVLHFPDGRWYCPCADFQYRGSERPCKHVTEAMRQEASGVG